MSEAIDETWKLGPVMRHRIELVQSSGFTEIGVMFSEHDLAEDRAKLAACAPEALRMLLLDEWDNQDQEYGGPVCPRCHRWKQASEIWKGGHNDSCAWLAIMKKASLR